jgi:hypothetical protein
VALVVCCIAGVAVVLVAADVGGEPTVERAGPSVVASDAGDADATAALDAVVTSAVLAVIPTLVVVKVLLLLVAVAAVVALPVTGPEGCPASVANPQPAAASGLVSSRPSSVRRRSRRGGLVIDAVTL